MKRKTIFFLLLGVASVYADGYSSFEPETMYPNLSKINGFSAESEHSFQENITQIKEVRQYLVLGYQNLVFLMLNKYCNLGLDVTSQESTETSLIENIRRYLEQLKNLSDLASPILEILHQEFIETVQLDKNFALNESDELGENLRSIFRIGSGFFHAGTDFDCETSLKDMAVKHNNQLAAYVYFNKYREASWFDNAHSVSVERKAVLHDFCELHSIPFQYLHAYLVANSPETDVMGTIASLDALETNEARDLVNIYHVQMLDQVMEFEKSGGELHSEILSHYAKDLRSVLIKKILMDRGPLSQKVMAKTVNNLLDKPELGISSEYKAAMCDLTEQPISLNMMDVCKVLAEKTQSPELVKIYLEKLFLAIEVWPSKEVEDAIESLSGISPMAYDTSVNLILMNPRNSVNSVELPVQKMMKLWKDTKNAKAGLTLSILEKFRLLFKDERNSETTEYLLPRAMGMKTFSDEGHTLGESVDMLKDVVKNLLLLAFDGVPEAKAFLVTKEAIGLSMIEQLFDTHTSLSLKDAPFKGDQFFVNKLVYSYIRLILSYLDVLYQKNEMPDVFASLVKQ